MSNVVKHAAAVVDSIGLLHAENERLAAENEKHERLSYAQTKRIETLEQTLATAEQGRDFYMRFSTVLVTQLSNIRLMCEEAEREAHRNAYRPKDLQAKIPEEQLQKVVAALAPAPGEA